MQSKTKDSPRPLYQDKKHKIFRIQEQKSFKMQITRVSITNTTEFSNVALYGKLQNKKGCKMRGGESLLYSSKASSSLKLLTSNPR